MKHFNQLFHKNIIQKITIYGSVITLTGTDGTADITINDIPNKVSATFLTDLTTTAKNWVAANIEHYEYHGYSVSASSGVIAVTPKSDWDTVNRINATIANLTEDLSGTLTGVFEPDFSKADIWDVTFTMDSTVANPKNSRDGDKMTLRVVGTGFYTLSWGDGWGSDNSLPYINTDVITIKVQQSNGVSFAKATFLWSSYWSHQSEVLFFGLCSEIADGKMPNKVIGATDYLTVAGVAGSETYQVPNTAPYQTADTDYIWFKTDVSQRTTTTAELIGYDFTRTIVKYDNTAPYAIEAIMILKSDVDIARMRNDFNLSVWWSNVLSAYGNVKGNRGVGQSVWTPEICIPTGLTLTLISGGVKVDWTDKNAGLAQTEIWGQSDGAVSALLYTINAGIVTKNDTGVTPVDLRYYKIRAKVDTNYSSFTAEQSIAMLGSELMPSVNVWAATGLAWWNYQHDLNWSGDGSKMTSNGNGNCWRINSVFISPKGKSYRQVVTYNRTSGSFTLYDAGNGNTAVVGNVSGLNMASAIYYQNTENYGLYLLGSNYIGTIEAISIKQVLAP